MLLTQIQDKGGKVALLEMQGAADTMSLLRSFVAHAMSSGPKGITPSASDAFFQAACCILDATPVERESTRTALMALRDLVWRVDSVRSVLASQGTEPAVAEALTWLDTSDIHLFLKQEP